tara:strand:- start:2990 stop:3829 length:840 start_codon:yes stop_codon:yes gene_type:complete
LTQTGFTPARCVIVVSAESVKKRAGKSAIGTRVWRFVVKKTLENVVRKATNLREFARSIEWLPLDQIHHHPDNPRKQPRKQLIQLKKSIQAFGFRFTVLLDKHSRLICGHARVEAAKQLKMQQVPAIRADDLSEDQVRGLMIADNRLTEISQWDDQLLVENLKILYDMELDFEIDSIGFDYGEIEFRVENLSSHPEVSEPSPPEAPEVKKVIRVRSITAYQRPGKTDGPRIRRRNSGVGGWENCAYDQVPGHRHRLCPRCGQGQSQRSTTPFEYHEKPS